MQKPSSAHRHTATALRHHPLAAAACATLLATALQAPNAALAQPSAAPSLRYELPALVLDEALARLARQAGLQLIANDALVKGKTGHAVPVTPSLPAALERLLQGTGLRARVDNATIVIESALPTTAAPSDRADSVLPAVHARAKPLQETAISPVPGYLARRSATATKTDTPIIETPQSISVVTADRMQAIGASNMREALGYTPGVNIEPFGPDSRFETHWINLRGFSGTVPGPYLDGLALRNNNSWAVWRSEIYGLERVEVLRGPSSLLYGEASPGGMVHLLSKRPQAEAQREIELQLGSHASRQAAGDMTGALDADGHWLYRLVSVARRAGYPVGGEHDKHLYLAPSLSWQPDASTSLTLLSHLLHSRAGLYSRYALEAGTLVPTAAGTRVPRTYIGDPDFDHMAHDQWAMGYAFEHRFGSGTRFRQNLRFGRVRVQLDQIFTPVGYVTVNPDDPGDPANFRLVNRNSFGSNERARTFAIDNQLEQTWTTLGWSHTLLGGIDHQRSHFTQTSYVGDAGAPLDLYQPVYGQPMAKDTPYFDGWTRLAQTGLYGQWQGKSDQGWVLTLGGRHDKARIESDNRADGSHDQSSPGQFSWRAGAVWLMGAGWAPYASYATAFNPLAQVDPATGKAFRPETSRQWEAGVRWQPPGTGHSLSAAVFDLRRQNTLSTGADGLARQVGEIAVQGLELEALIQPTRTSHLTLAYSCTPKAEVTRSAIAEEIGLNTEGVSRHSLSLWFDQRLGPGWTAGLGLRRTGANRGIGQTALARVPAHTLADAALGYDSGDWALRLNVRNLADKTYFASCGYGTCNFGEQREVNLTATYQW
jgi:iron complex outermembrane receptor protein